jgi:hypothetical protein
MISRATFTYVVMLAVFFAGLWAILSFGSILLHAPEDLAGRWELSDVAGAKPPGKMNVEQSGRFFKLTVNGSMLNLKLTGEEAIEGRRADVKRIRLSSDSAKAVFEGVAGGDEFQLELSGPVSGRWMARRVERTYPKPEPAAGKKLPTTAPATAPVVAHARP